MPPFRGRPSIPTRASPFERLKGKTGASVELSVTGQRLEERSANAVGILAPEGASAREVILSAHHDSSSLVSPENLERAARLVARVVEKVR